MNIGYVNLSWTRDWPMLDFKVDFTLDFSQTEVDLNFEFDYGIVLWESDDGEPFGGGDDIVYTRPNEVINPASTTETISRVLRVAPDELDTESGNEEIWAEVYAKNLTTGGGVISRKSDLWHIDE
jgi:hypothetical protein